LKGRKGEKPHPPVQTGVTPGNRLTTTIRQVGISRFYSKPAALNLIPVML